MKAYSLLLFYVCFNLACAALMVTDLVPVGAWGQHTEGEVASEFQLIKFDIVSVSAIGAGITVAGILGYFTKAYGLTLGLLLIWVVGVVFAPVQWLFLGLPVMLDALLPPSVQIISSIFVVLFTIVFFMFFVEILGGRQVT